MQYTTFDEFLADLPEAAMKARESLRGQNGTFRLNTRQGRSFFILLRDGEVTLPQEYQGTVDCTVTADEQDILAMLSGKLNPAKALLFGRVKVQGSMTKLLALARLAG